MRLSRSVALDLSLTHSRAVTVQTWPNLVDVDVEDLASGLESGLFTSVDLVNVLLMPGTPSHVVLV